MRGHVAYVVLGSNELYQEATPPRVACSPFPCQGRRQKGLTLTQE
jgi:hypothetical protein